MYRMDVLEKLEKGHISVNKAISMLKHPPKPKPLPKYRDIRKLVNCLRICKSTGLVEVQDDSSTVIISVI